DAVLGLVNLDAVEHAEKIEVPPGAAELAVARQLKAELFLLLDDLLDLAVLDRLELGGADGALFALGARFLERRRAQEAADMIGTERRFGLLHRSGSLGQLTASKGTLAAAASTTKQQAKCPPRRGGAQTTIQVGRRRRVNACLAGASRRR